MSHPCPATHCDRPASGAVTICGACEAELERALATVATWLAEELDVTLSKQHTRTGGGTAEVEADVAPAVLHIGALGYDPRAAEAIYVLRSALVGWVRALREAPEADTDPADTLPEMAAWLSARLSRLVKHPAAEEAHGEIVTAVADAQRVVDRPGERWYAGICAAPLDGDDRCQRDLYARPGAAEVTCPACRTRWDVKQRREWLLGMAEDVLATATEIARAVTTLGQPVTPEAIRGLVHRKQLFARGTRLVGKREMPVYRLGDVLDVIARRAERDGKVAS